MEEGEAVAAAEQPRGRRRQMQEQQEPRRQLREEQLLLGQAPATASELLRESAASQEREIRQSKRAEKRELSRAAATEDAGSDQDFYSSRVSAADPHRPIDNPRAAAALELSAAQNGRSELSSQLHPLDDGEPTLHFSSRPHKAHRKPRSRPDSESKSEAERKERRRKSREKRKRNKEQQQLRDDGGVGEPLLKAAESEEAVVAEEVRRKRERKKKQRKAKEEGEEAVVEGEAKKENEEEDEAEKIKERKRKKKKHRSKSPPPLNDRTLTPGRDPLAPLPALPSSSSVSSGSVNRLAGEADYRGMLVQQQIGEEPPVVSSGASTLKASEDLEAASRAIGRFLDEENAAGFGGVDAADGDEGDDGDEEGEDFLGGAPVLSSKLAGNNNSSSQLQNLSSSVSSRSDLNDNDLIGASNLSLESSRSASTTKKKTTSSRKWYSAFYPTYKSRSEDFRKNFPSLGDDRLVVEYSCALQKDILVHGRMYVTLNNLCFYANIFRWETSLIIPWKDVVSLTKEKTALVIPNAIQVHTGREKYFLTSFTARDKTYLMLHKLWQNAIGEEISSPSELWRMIHTSYGDELGLTTDDEPDYVHPSGLSAGAVDGGGQPDWTVAFSKKSSSSNIKDFFQTTTALLSFSHGPSSSLAAHC